MGRLLNYAFLLKLGFKVKTGRIINPSSVFYTDRDRYYDMLSNADSLTDKDILQWCEYFLLGLKNEIEKIDSLLNQDYVKNNILLPALKLARQSEHVTAQEFDILEYLINKSDMAMKSQELESMGITSSKQETQR
jgi:tyrosyl-tRNA synthetase